MFRGWDGAIKSSDKVKDEELNPGNGPSAGVPNSIVNSDLEASYESLDLISKLISLGKSTKVIETDVVGERSGIISRIR